MKTHRWFPCLLTLGTLTLLASFSSALLAQEEAAEPMPPEMPKILDEPRAVDPGTLVPEILTVKKSADLKGATISEVAAWLEKECQVEVVVNKRAIEDIGMLATDPVGEEFTDTPVYQFLDRLRLNELAWYLDDNVLHITTINESESQLEMITYNAGDLLDAGYEMDRLVETITTTLEPDMWEELGGPGVVNAIGDVLFVRQTPLVQRKLQGLLSALRQHGRRTFIYDPPQHQRIREQLQKPITVELDNVALSDAAQQIGEIAGIDIRLDVRALRDVAIRERTPVSVGLANTSADTVLKALLQDLDLTWVLRDGVLWITTLTEAETDLTTAVFDVRDLCVDDSESDALIEALTSQSAEDWEDLGGPGSIAAPKAGVLVVSNREELLNEVLNLLEAYRTALRGSKRREVKGEDPNEVITVYYRMQADVAQGLAVVLRQLVQPETWKSEVRPDAVGTIFNTASNNEISTATNKKGEAQPATRLVIPQAVLIITQTRARHDEISKIIRRVEKGDSTGPAATDGQPNAGGGLGGGGGGFGGGGFF